MWKVHEIFTVLKIQKSIVSAETIRGNMAIINLQIFITIFKKNTKKYVFMIRKFELLLLVFYQNLWYRNPKLRSNLDIGFNFSHVFRFFGGYKFWKVWNWTQIYKNHLKDLIFCSKFCFSDFLWWKTPQTIGN